MRVRGLVSGVEGVEVGTPVSPKKDEGTGDAG